MPQDAQIVGMGCGMNNQMPELAHFQPNILKQLGSAKFVLRRSLRLFFKNL
ncbi:MAG: hypothetical protein LH679_08970 [Cyanobacteria bacterium CAN_BIN43]|nr:hypothetical protein [Cyanobacteria bacterium CAN_BIN43]